PPLMARIVARWFADGTAERLAAEKRAETRSRNHRAREILAAAELSGDPAAAHLWLTLPEPWRADDFAAAARCPGDRLRREPSPAQRGAHLPRRSDYSRAGRAWPRPARGPAGHSAGALFVGRMSGSARLATAGQICWMAESSHCPPRRRTKVHISSASTGRRGSPPTSPSGSPDARPSLIV